MTPPWSAKLLEGCPALRRHAHGEVIAAIAAAALDAVDPRACVRRHVHRLERPTGTAAVVGEYVFDLAATGDVPGPREHGRIWIVGAGKASVAMAGALVEIFGEHVGGGLIVAKHANQADPGAIDLGPVRVCLGDHPTPGAASLAARDQLVELAARVQPRDLVLCPVSGGASALATDPTLPLDQWATLTGHFLAHDVPIHALNRIRRRLDRLKAGGLARLFAPATVVGLIVSDVVGDDLALVGSGPTVYASPADASEAHAALMEDLRDVLDDLPPPIASAIRDSARPAARPEAPTAQQVYQVLIARNGDAREAACRAARANGLDSLIVLPAITGPAEAEAERVATPLADPSATLPVRPPVCLVYGGEPTVHIPRSVQADAHGGRNQTLALAAAGALARIARRASDSAEPATDLAVLALATDGEDGPTDAAGAFVTQRTLELAAVDGLDVATALRTRRSYPLLDQLGSLLYTGPTGTNVCDLVLALRWMQ